nr:uncharacterized protein LOC111835159 [Paramormyrops kingsleyae]
MVLSLVQTFPTMNDGSDSGYDIWYTKARKVIKDGGVFHYPVTGFLEERLRNVRKRSNRGCTQQMPEATQSRRAYIPESTIPEERAFQQKEWLKHNSEPFTQVQSYMKDTVLCRANWIRDNSSKDILELFTEYPHLTSPGMIAQDFQVLHGEAAPKLFETWIPEYAEKVLYLAKQDNKLPSLSVEDMTLDAKGELALTLLPTMVPQAFYRVWKKTIRHSIEESRTAFIHQMPLPETLTTPVRLSTAAEASSGDLGFGHRMDLGDPRSTREDLLLTIKLRELELEIKRQEYQSQLLRVWAVEIEAEKELELRQLSMGDQKPMPLPRKLTDIDLEDTFMSVPVLDKPLKIESVTPVPDNSVTSPEVPSTRDALISAQKEDPSLEPCRASAMDKPDVKEHPTAYFFRDRVLMRQWSPPDSPFEWATVFQERNGMRGYLSSFLLFVIL